MNSRRAASAGQGGYLPLGSNDAIVSQLSQTDHVPWYKKPNLRLLYLFMFPTCLAVETTNGFDASLVNGLQAVPSWLEYYHYPRSASLGLMVALYSLGAVAATPIAPIVVDKFGRRYPILLGGIISIIGGVLQGSASNLAMFIAARFILGFANIMGMIAASSLVGELSHPKERAAVAAFFIVFHRLGAILAAGVTLGTFAMPNNWSWRIPSFIQAAPSLLQVSFIWFIPESPRWLISMGRENEAYVILAKYHAEGGEDSEFVNAEYAQIKQVLEAGQKIAGMNRQYMLSTAGMRKRIIVATFLGLFAHWSGVGLISHFLVPILDSIGIHGNRTKNIINLARDCWGLMNAVVIAPIVPLYPRRRMYLICTVSVLIVFTALTAASAEYSLSHNMYSARIVLVFIFLFTPVFSIGMILNQTYLVELFPFHVRAKGIATCQWWNRCGTFIIHFANPIGMDAIGWRWYIVYCLWNAFQVAFVYFMFPETSGRTLEELTFLYEDDREAFQHIRIEILHEHGGTGSYGTMDDVSRRIICSEQE